MVKRAKLTLNHGKTKEHIMEEKEADVSESVVTEQTIAPDSQRNLGRGLIIAALTIASLIIFRQKFF